MSHDNYDTICCAMFKITPMSDEQLEASSDDNDNDIFITYNTNTLHSSIKPIIFFSESYVLGSNMFMVRKVSTCRTYSIILTCEKDDNGVRRFVKGVMFKNKKEYKVKDFKTYRKLVVDGKDYESSVICVVEDIVS